MKSRIMRGMFAMLAFPLSLSASLGGDVTSVQADQVKMQGTLRTTSSDSYTVHEIRTSTGVAVKEFVSPPGKVFAVTCKDHSSRTCGSFWARILTIYASRSGSAYRAPRPRPAANSAAWTRTSSSQYPHGRLRR
jgi:hypothetical protein